MYVISFESARDRNAAERDRLVNTIGHNWTAEIGYIPEKYFSR